MKKIIIAFALTLLSTAGAMACCGDSYTPGDGQSAQIAEWNGKYGKDAFAWRSPNLSYSVNRSRQAAINTGKQIDLTHKAKTGPQYPGGYADNGLKGKGRTRAETGGPRGNKNGSGDNSGFGGNTGRGNR